MTLEETYYEIYKILGNNAEPLESVRLVETYRRYLKPEKVRVVLLAESHVFTSDEDRRIAIPLIDGLPGYPKQYAAGFQIDSPPHFQNHSPPCSPACVTG